MLNAFEAGFFELSRAHFFVHPIRRIDPRNEIGAVSPSRLQGRCSVRENVAGQIFPFFQYNGNEKRKERTYMWEAGDPFRGSRFIPQLGLT